MAHPEAVQAVSRLAQYRPFDDEGHEAAAALRDLLTGAAAIEGGGFASLAAARDGLRSLWGIDAEIVEVREAVAVLASQGMCTQQAGGFQLTPETLAEMEETRVKSEATEALAFSEWRASVAEFEPRLTDGDLDALDEDLRAWLAQVIARHGVEAALLLYPENPRAVGLFEAIEALGLDFLPKRAGCAGEVRDAAFQQFVRRPTAAQRTYIASLMNTSFYMTVLTLDPEASALVQDRVSGHRVYLDTNFLYALLGLSSASDAWTAGRLVELTLGLGYQLAVTPWTVDELRTSLNSAERRLKAKPLPRRDLAGLMAQAGDQQGFIRGFWLSYREKGTQPKDFFDYFAAIETHLEEHGIAIEKEGCLAVDRNQKAVDEQLVLLDRFINGWREDAVKEHDVKHRLLVERLRGDGNLRFSNARYWFLTRDSRLPRYAMTTIDGHSVSLPFCVSTSAWLQVVRAFTPRTDDFDQSLVELLASPYVRNRGGISARVVEDIVGRVDRFEGATPKLASEVLTDTALVRRIEKAPEEDKDELVREALIAKAGAAHARLETADAREADLRRDASSAQAAREAVARERDAAAGERDVVAGERDAAAARAAELEAAVTKEQAARQAELEAAETRHAQEADTLRDAAAETSRKAQEAHAASEANAEKLAKQLDEEKAQRGRLEGEVASVKRWLTHSAAGVIAIVAMVGAVLLLVLHVVEKPAPVTAVVSAAVLALCASAWLTLGPERSRKVFGVLAFAFGVIGVVAGVVALL